MTRNRRNQGGKAQNVRILDPYSGESGARVDRQIAHLVASESQITALVTGTFALDVSATTSVQTVYDWARVRTLDDFVSLRAQYNTYRVRSIRFDVYDINPGFAQTGIFSTFHDSYNPGGVPVFSFEDVADGPDSQVVPPGVGKAVFTWMAHNTNERGYYDATPDTDAAAPDFGGLRAFISQGTTAGPKFRIIMKAVVDFRGRR
jgi:hypothetical protein